MRLDGAPPDESLRTVRRAVVGRWWLQVKPLMADGQAGGMAGGSDVGFQAQAHTMRGEPGVWAGEVRPTLAQATDDAVGIVDHLRLLN